MFPLYHGTPITENYISSHIEIHSWSMMSCWLRVFSVLSPHSSPLILIHTLHCVTHFAEIFCHATCQILAKMCLES